MFQLWHLQIVLLKTGCTFQLLPFCIVLNGLSEPQVHHNAGAVICVLFSVVTPLHEAFLKTFSQFVLKTSEACARNLIFIRKSWELSKGLKSPPAVSKPKWWYFPPSMFYPYHPSLGNSGWNTCKMPKTAVSATKETENVEAQYFKLVIRSSVVGASAPPSVSVWCESTADVQQSWALSSDTEVSLTSKLS